MSLTVVFVGYWRDGAAANGKNAYSYLAVMRLNCLKYLDRSFGSVDTSQGSIKFSDSRRSRALSWQPSPTVYLSNYTYALLCLRLLLDSISELGRVASALSPWQPAQDGAVSWAPIGKGWRRGRRQKAAQGRKARYVRQQTRDMGCGGSKPPEDILVPQSDHPDHILINGALSANTHIELHSRIAKDTGLTTVMTGHGAPGKPPRVKIYEKPEGGGVVMQLAQDLCGQRVKPTAECDAHRRPPSRVSQVGV